MDGTMIDSEILHYQAYKDVLAELGIDFIMENYLPYFGAKDENVCTDLVKKFNLLIENKKLLENKNNTFNNKYMSKIVPQKGLFELLRKLKENNYPLAIASSSQLHDIEMVLAKLNIKDYFKAIVSAELVEYGKPAPDIFLLAAQKLNIMPKNCLVLEDSLRGVQAAKSAGMTCYAIPTNWSKSEDFSNANKILDSLNDVYAYLKNEP